jgi:hypothetical protein
MKRNKPHLTSPKGRKIKCMMIKKYIIALFLFPLWGLGGIQAQEKDKDLPKGNDAFEEKNYADAEADYRISQSKFAKNSKSSYNLGNAIYRQKQAAEAKYQFARAIKNAKIKIKILFIIHDILKKYVIHTLALLKFNIVINL